VPDKRKGERVVLVTTAAADASALRQHWKKSGATELSMPSDIVRADDIPLLGTGKIDYGATRKLADAQLGREAAA
jgi:acyl-[acyl-carrier-protein]-phospholipid O-acyltransferase / long-chain-fatty-acid--[acyl-carrier-protein] ligase